MRGGRAQLQVRGVADVYLAGDPQITYWKTAYKRHSLFATESIAQTFDREPDFGTTTRCVLARHGDLAGPAWLEVSLPALSGFRAFRVGQDEFGEDVLVPIEDYALSYVEGIGHAIVEHVSLRIGEQLVDRHPGEWLHALSELDEPDAKLPGLRELVGAAGGAGPLTLHVPLKFCYNRDPGLYLPLAALSAQEVSYEFSFRGHMQLIGVTTSDGTVPSYVAILGVADRRPPRATIRLHVEYVMLDLAERLKVMEQPRTLLVSALHYQDYGVAAAAAPAAAAAAAPRSLDLALRGRVVKELVWTYREKRRDTEPGALTSYDAFGPASTAVQRTWAASLGASSKGYSGLWSTSSVTQAYDLGPLLSQTTIPATGWTAIDLQPYAACFQNVKYTRVYFHAGIQGQCVLAFWRPGLAVPETRGEYLGIGGATMYLTPTADEPNRGLLQRVDIHALSTFDQLFLDHERAYLGYVGDGFPITLPGQQPYQFKVDTASSFLMVLRFQSGTALEITLGQKIPGVKHPDSCLRLKTMNTATSLYALDGNRLFFLSLSASTGTTVLSANGGRLMGIQEINGIPSYLRWLARAPLATSGRRVVLGLKTPVSVLGKSYPRLFFKQILTGPSPPMILELFLGDATPDFRLLRIEATSIPSTYTISNNPFVLQVLTSASDLPAGLGPLTTDAAAAPNDVDTWVRLTLVNGSVAGVLRFAADSVELYYSSLGASIRTSMTYNGTQALSVSAGTYLDITPRAVDFFTQAQLYVDGKPRLPARPPEFFRTLQPYRHHLRAPDSRIYTYSFALRPDDHEPSGHANFSIQRAPQLRFVPTPDVEEGVVRVYARCVNVLKIRGGVADLLLSDG